MAGIALELAGKAEVYCALICFPWVLGPQAGDLLAIPDHKPRHWLVRLLEIVFNREEWRIGLIGKAFRGLTYMMSYELIRALRGTYNKGKEAPFHIPSTISGD